VPRVGTNYIDRAMGVYMGIFGNVPTRTQIALKLRYWAYIFAKHSGRATVGVRYFAWVRRPAGRGAKEEKQGMPHQHEHRRSCDARRATRPGYRLLTVALAAAGLLASCGGSGSNGTTARDAALTDAIRTGMRRAFIPGVIVGIWQDARSPYVRAFGVRDTATGEPMRTDLYMRIGSVTKTFTVTAVLQLVDQGLMRLDDPISDYVDDVPNGDRITLRQLAAMRSGLFNYAPLTNSILEKDPAHHWTPQELMDISYPNSPCFEPDERFDYSNINTILLGLAVQEVLCRSQATCSSLETYIEDFINRPAGLRHTVFPTDASFPSPHSQGYTKLANGSIADAANWDPSSAWAAGGMISQLDDLRVWTRVLATGELISADLQRERLEFQPAPGEGDGAEYGLGIENDNGWIGHTGNFVGYLTFADYLPSERITMVIMFNASIDVLGSLDLVRDITRIISPNNVWPNPPSGPEPECPPKASEGLF
jgi:D-alanyl-D-alanine carboxypeptidase